VFRENAMSRERILVVDDSPTILKLVQLALTKADYRVTTAASAVQGLAAAREEQPALVLLDSDMPDMDGLALAAAMAEDPRLASIPVVLMNARAGQDGRAPRPANLFDAISKPFSPEALLAVTGHVLARRRQSEDDIPTDVGQDTGSGGLQAVLQTTPPPSDAQVARDATAALSGDLRIVALSDVLTLLADEGQTGLLGVSLDNARLRIYLRKGLVDFATAEGIPEEFLLGRFLVKTGAMDPDTLVAALEARQSLPPAEGQTSLFGAFLVQRGLVTSPDLARAIALQTSALIFEGLRWGAGRFTFEPRAELPGAADQAALALQVPSLLLEGFRRVDEWRLIEREMGDFDQVFVREEERLARLGRGRLAREEQVVLELVDGRRSVRDLLDRSALGAFDTTKMLYRLLKLRLIRRRLAPIAV
jgi:CheY-like chemotaxis protein